MENDQEETPETRVCNSSNCPFSGEPQPIDNFKKHVSSGKHMKACRGCKAEKKPKPADENHPDSLQPLSPPNEDQLTIDFKDHKDLLEELTQAAKNELRSVKNQALWTLIKVQKIDKSMEGEGV